MVAERHERGARRDGVLVIVSAYVIVRGFCLVRAEFPVELDNL